MIVQIGVMGTYFLSLVSAIALHLVLLFCKRSVWYIGHLANGARRAATRKL
jgi:hypothetical protein